MLAGLIGGGLIGYFRFAHSPVWTTVLGLGLACILGSLVWKDVHDPELAKLRDGSEWKPAGLRLALLGSALVVATAIGLATHSKVAFLVIFGVGLAVVLALRLTIRR